MEYNVDGSLKTRTDQREVVLTYVYDERRRLTDTDVTSLGAGAQNVDGAIRSIGSTYDSLNRLTKKTSYDKISTDSGRTVENEIQYVYSSGLNKVRYLYQNHDGAVNTSTSPKMEYVFDTSVTSPDYVFDDSARVTNVWYRMVTGARLINNYGGAINDRLNRVNYTKLIDGALDPGTNWDSNYLRYNGLGRVAHALGRNNTGYSVERKMFSATGNYDSWDRFGRTVKQKWTKYNTPYVRDEINYTYDYAGNRTSREDVLAATNSVDIDQTYDYDDLHRLKGFKEGNLVAGAITGTPAKAKDWTLDPLGNWGTFVEKAAGTTTLNQTRTHNDANELGAIAASTGTNWADGECDAAGNMKTIPKPNDLANGYTATYDAWNRLVKIVDGSTTVAEYEYDG